MFVPLAQTFHSDWAPFGELEFDSSHFLVARTTGDPLAAADAIRAAVNRLDRNLSLTNVRTMESRLSESMAERRFVMALISAFAALALILSVVGLYGVMAYTVTERRSELGIRAAMGATAASLLRLVLVDGLRTTAMGAAIGLSLAIGLSQVMTAQLFQVKAIDPIIYAGVTVLFFAVSYLASSVSALQAARTNPAPTLRSE